MKDKSVLILGATSAVARSLAACFAREGARLYLAGRDAFEVERVAADLSVRFGVEARWGRFEATEYGAHQQFFDEVVGSMGGLDAVVSAMGELGDQGLAEADFNHARAIMESNYNGPASILTYAAGYLEKRGGGLIIGISSVAGDRGRRSNYVYGSAKGAFSLFLQGLRNRLSACGVKVMTVKPGFMDTKMTFGRTGMFLVAKPEDVAETIFKAAGSGVDVLYVPWFWRWIMLIIKLIPEPVFKRMKL
ncbi:MAG TPA: SDR family oxidoreductase [Candidatus Obscuribacterales bacterium]